MVEAGIFKDSSDFLAWQAQARNAGLMVTNFFPEPRKMDDWIQREVVSAVDGSEGCRLMVVKEDGFHRLFYAAADIDEAANACEALQRQVDEVCVLDVVGPETIQAATRISFGRVGFAPYKTLTRMQRRKGVVSYDGNQMAVPRLATEADAIHIYGALHKYFDVRAEQLPCLEEVKGLCTNGSSYVAVVGSTVCSFLLGEVLGRKGTVRYWFTAPEGRGNGAGGVVMRAFLAHCLECGCSYQELWVIDDNENAIKRYERYGFAFDRLKDSVYIKGA